MATPVKDLSRRLRRRTVPQHEESLTEVGLSLTRVFIVEPPGIEPGSMWHLCLCYDHPRPCDSWLSHPRVGCLKAPESLSSRPGALALSQVFPRRHSSLLLPGCDELAPCAGYPVTITLPFLGGKCELRVGSYFFALFYESEQLGSRSDVQVSMSKPFSPLPI